MSDILDDLKMMADHCDQENDDEPCDLGMLLIRAIAEIRNLRPQPVSEVATVGGIPVQTGHAEADRLIGRLMSSDPDYDDCADASALIQREIKGPDGFATWREAAIAERIRRTQQPVSAAEVPMPDVHDYGYHDSDNGWVETLACDESDVRTYGDQCREAGYVAGVAAGVAALVALKPQSGVNSDGTAWLLPISRQDCVEAVAALRGEVKP